MPDAAIDRRARLLSKIVELRAKTASIGCTEAEALAAPLARRCRHSIEGPSHHRGARDGNAADAGRAAADPVTLAHGVTSSALVQAQLGYGNVHG
ncbi:hypothetical protein [Lichenihabitans psoromatis]|uniref:hypothetical protein n=1 Tax=Lichenihabitans psoromatis TaxID=2528642 RepID=UPI0010364CB1|nr:hypothetical protein [Lichenihabitans psoromatis]